MTNFDCNLEQEIIIGDCGLNSTGPKGPKGDKGEPGAVGQTGAQGPRGEQGIPGPKGEKGDRGPRGEQGVKGDRGLRGEEGPQGNEGPVGPVGATGPIGPRGPQGEPGPQGLQGVPGPRGERGPQGPPGPAGSGGGGSSVDAYTKEEANRNFVLAPNRYPEKKVTNADEFFEEGLTKVKNERVQGLPIKKYGVLYNVFENSVNGTGTQTFYPVDAKDNQLLYMRQVSFMKRPGGRVPVLGKWQRVLFSEDLVGLQAQLKETQQQLGVLTLKYEKMLMTLGLEDEELPQFGTLEETEHKEETPTTTEEV